MEEDNGWRIGDMILQEVELQTSLGEEPMLLIGTLTYTLEEIGKKKVPTLPGLSRNSGIRGG